MFSLALYLSVTRNKGENKVSVVATAGLKKLPCAGRLLQDDKIEIMKNWCGAGIWISSGAETGL